MQALKCAIIVNITACKIKSQKSNKKTDNKADEVVKLASLYIYIWSVFLMVFIYPNTVFNFYCKVCFAKVTTHYSV